MTGDHRKVRQIKTAATIGLCCATVLPQTAAAQNVAVVDVRVGIADPRPLGALAASRNVEFGLVSAPRRESGAVECLYSADPDQPTLARRTDGVTFDPNAERFGCGFLAGAPQPGIVDVACDMATSVTLTFRTQTITGRDRAILQFSPRLADHLKVNDAPMERFDGNCSQGSVRLTLSPRVVVPVGALPSAGVVSVGTIRIEADFS